MSNVSIIMVSYHTGPSLWLAIASALREPECKELILLDNGNVPYVSQRLQEMAAQEPRMILLAGHGNVGFARGCNMGAQRATGETILLLNPDCMLPQGSLARACDILSRYPEKTLAGCYLSNMDGSEQRGSRRALLTPENALAEVLGLQRFIGKGRLNLHGEDMPTATHEVPVISGAFMLLSKAFYTSIGGMDEGYFLHMDDMDFCYRVAQAGGKVLLMPEVKVMHFRSTSEVSSNFIEKQKAKGFTRYFTTHFKGRPILLKLMTLGIWARYGVKYFMNAVDGVFEPPLAGRQEVARLVLLYQLAQFAPQTSALSGKTVLVVGATGQVGLCVIGKALGAGANVIGIYHSTRIPFEHPRLQWIQADISDAGEALDNVKADILVYAAALWLLPVMMPKLANAGLTRIIGLSSTSIFAKADSKNAFEKDISNRLVAAEKEVTAMESESLHVTILRPTMVYGVGLDANVTRMADIVRRFGILPHYKAGSGLRHPLQVLDLANAVMDIVSNPKTFGQSYNLGCRQSLTYRAMMEAIFTYLQKKPRFASLPFLPAILNLLGLVYPFTQLNGQMALRMNQNMIFDIQPAIDDFGFAPHDFLMGEVVL